MLIGLTLAASAILTQSPLPAEGKPLPAPDCRRLLTPAPGKRSLCEAIDAMRVGTAADDLDKKRQHLTTAADLFSRAASQLRDPD